MRLLDLVSTNETSFFREWSHFELLATRVFPAWRAQAAAGRRARRVRAWSAACSTGQEPFSLAMLLREHFAPGEGWELEIVATDISTRVLQQAESAVWPIAKAAEIPTPLLKKYMLRGGGTQAGRMRAGPELRQLVRFQRLNLNEPPYAIDGPFDLIFCRNVLIYFTAEGRAAVVGRLVPLLAPEGHLFLGHAESLQGQPYRMRPVIPTVYTRAAADGGVAP